MFFVCGANLVCVEVNLHYAVSYIITRHALKKIANCKHFDQNGSLYNVECKACENWHMHTKKNILFSEWPTQ